MKNNLFGLVLLMGILAMSACSQSSVVNGFEIISDEYDSILSFSEGVAAVKKNGKWGFIDTTGIAVISPQYDRPNVFGYDWQMRNGMLLIQDKDDKYGFMNRSGEVVIPCKYDYAEPFACGRACIMKKSMWGDQSVGFVDEYGQERILDYDHVMSFYDNIACVIKNEKVGFIDVDYDVVLPTKYDMERDFGMRHFFPGEHLQNDGYIEFHRRGKSGLMDYEGTMIVPCEYDYLYSFHEGLAAAAKYGKVGFIDRTGQEVISCKYDDARSFSECLACVKSNNKWGIIDKEGREIVPFVYDDAKPFSEGLAGVKKGEKWGFINREAKELIPCSYDDVNGFSEGLAWVKKEGRWGVIDVKGREVVPCVYAYTYDAKYAGGISVVKMSDYYGIINAKGDEILPCQYAGIEQVSENLAVINDSGKWVLIRFLR